MPIFFRAFEPETIRDVLMGRLTRRVLLYLDWVEYARLIREHGAELKWSSQNADNPASCAAISALASEKCFVLPGFFGGPFRARTGDPLIKSQLLYQLS